jgi:hypothetical protein
MRLARTVLQWLIYGGSFRMRTYERTLLNRAAAELGDVERDLLVEQIGRVARVKRLLGDRQVNFFFTEPPTGSALLLDAGEAPCRVKLTLRTLEGKMHAAVVTHRGRLSSLEFSRSPAVLKDTQYEVVSVALDAPHRSPASVADRIEHGRA